MSTTTALPEAAAPYEALAEVYDLLTAGYAHERWLGELERLARAHGLRGRRVLDVACGTGSSFLSLLDAGFFFFSLPSRIATTRSPRSMTSSPEAGLRVVATRGQRTGAILDAGVDEDVCRLQGDLPRRVSVTVSRAHAHGKEARMIWVP